LPQENDPSHEKKMRNPRTVIEVKTFIFLY